MNTFTVNPAFLIKKYSARIFTLFALSILLTDIVYKTTFGITVQTKTKCAMYVGLPKWAFLIYENVIELFLVVIAGIFAGVLIEKYFLRLKKFIPTNIFTAFIYASVIPVCSCSVIPLIKTMIDKISFRVIITFIIAAPLLNPYIIMVSFSVLGIKYTILRILFSFILAASTGYIIELFYRKSPIYAESLLHGCRQKGNCTLFFGDVFDSTMANLKKIFPYILFAGALNLLFEVSLDKNFIKSIQLDNNLAGNLIIILVGVPMYFCNGADVVFLNPLIKYAHMPIGTALAFSLTSTSVCISSGVMLLKYIGKKFTGLLVISVFVISLILGLVANILM